MAKPDLKALLNQAQSSRNKILCATCRFLADAPTEDAETLRAALESDVSSVVISQALTNYGHKVSGSAVSRHRRECQ